MRTLNHADLAARESSHLLCGSSCLQINLLVLGEIEAGQSLPARAEQGRVMPRHQGLSTPGDQAGTVYQQWQQGQGQALCRWRGLRR
ncbi:MULTISPECIES: hypothetical protein [unclassified Prochlorococcus]|uniref:hypothetical protein n=1 Tax=unclassified Prochlorococcus TaxID=2627481 RepID=UPI0039A574B1